MHADELLDVIAQAGLEVSFFRQICGKNRNESLEFDF